MDEQDWELGVSEAWASAEMLEEEEFLALIEDLAAQAPAGSGGAGAFERGCSLDSTGHSDLAVALYREALEQGLSGERRRRAVIQMASSMRNLGQAEQSAALLRAEMLEGPDQLDDAVRAFLALALADTGREREAAALALGALAPHLPRYQRSLAKYAEALMEDAPEQAG